MRGRKKAWAEPFLRAHPELVITEIQGDDAFFRHTPLYLEIGMGKGDFLLGMAGKFPGHYLGIERDPSVAGMAAKKVVNAGMSENIRLICGDFDDYRENLNALRFATIYLNFSDPWPKKKHAKRRLTYAPRLKSIAELLCDGGRIVMKTDNADLYAFTLEQVPLAGLRLLEATADYLYDESKDACSEYEARFRAEGKNIHRLVISND